MIFMYTFFPIEFLVLFIYHNIDIIMIYGECYADNQSECRFKK